MGTMVSDEGLAFPNGLDVDSEAEAAADAIDCQSAEDFFRPTARDTIGRFCRRALDEQILTPSEILHSPRHQQSLSNAAAFVAVLHQADRALKRKGTLQALVNDVARLTRDRLKGAALPELTPASAPAALPALLSGANGRFLAEAALTQALQSHRSFADKARALVDLALALPEGEALALVDRFLSEVVRSDSGIASMAGELRFPQLADTLVTLIAADRALDPAVTPEVFLKIERAVAAASLPALAEGLIAAFQRLLHRDDRFVTAATGDLFGVETIQRELFELARHAQRLRSGDTYIGGPRTEEAFQRRGALLVNEDSIQEIIRGLGFIQKLRTLFLLQKMPLPPVPRNAVTGYLRQFLTSREFAPRLLDCWKDRSDKLRGVAEVQKLVNASAFPADERQELSHQMDDLQCSFIRTFHVLSSLTGKGDPPPDQVLEVLKLAAEEAFCKGRAKIGAARVLYRQVHRPRFLRVFFQNAGADRQARVDWLRNALGTVGVPFIDLAALRVLIVDDEPGPRRFVKSALHDMGVDTVEEASDGQEAIRKLEERLEEIDLVVCDWMMPRVPGIDVLKWVRERRPELPFLMVTALATPKAVQKAIENHVSAYIAKPFTPDQLEDKVFMALIAGGPAA
jgi:CheY-like chemotaxis protein